MSRANLYDLDKIKQQVSLPSLLSHYGLAIQGTNINCLWHEDSTPSLRIWADHGFCYGCRTYANVFQFVMKLENLRFPDAVEWLLKNQGILPQTVWKEQVRRYRGPVPGHWVDWWHRSLTDEKREYLYQRGLTDTTIDVNQIGYRPDRSAYVFPFWRGLPGRSALDTLQYRAEPGKDSKRTYFNEPGYGKPSLLNRYLVNPRLVIIVFGTVDALLGAQDGLPMVSASGVTQFVNSDRAENTWLRAELARTDKVVVLPDNTPSEFEPAQKLALQLGADIKYFRPEGPKDYNEYRLSGKSVEDFWTEVLDMQIIRDRYNFMWPIHAEHVSYIAKVIALMSRGEGETAFKVLQDVVRQDPESYGRPHVISWSLQRMTTLRLEPVEPVFDEQEWNQIAEDFSNCVTDNTYRGMAQVIDTWSEIARGRQGGF